MVLNIKNLSSENGTDTDLCDYIPNIYQSITLYSIIIPLSLALLWIIYKTFFLFLMIQVTRKNRNKMPSVSTQY